MRSKGHECLGVVMAVKICFVVMERGVRFFLTESIAASARWQKLQWRLLCLSLILTVVMSTLS